MTQDMQLTMQLTKTIQFLINGADYANKKQRKFLWYKLQVI